MKIWGYVLITAGFVVAAFFLLLLGRGELSRMGVLWATIGVAGIVVGGLMALEGLKAEILERCGMISSDESDERGETAENGS